MTRPRVAWQIMLPFFVLVLGAGFLGSYVVTRSVGSSFSERFENQLVEASRVAADGVVRREQRHLETVRSILYTDGFPAAVRDGDTGEIGAIALPIAANAGAETIEVLDATGHTLYALVLDEHGDLVTVSGPDRSTSEAVRLALLGQSDELGDRQAMVAEGPLGVTMYTLAPVIYSGEVRGVVLVGSPMATVIAELKQTALSDLTFYGNSGDAISTTFALDDTSVWDELAQSAPASGARRSFTLAGRHYELLLSALTLRGEQVGYLGVALPQDFITLAQGDATRRLVLLVGGAVLAMLAIGWLVSRSLTIPLSRLVHASRAVRGGDLTARSRVTRSDEIGDLAIAFDQMTEALERTHLGTLEALVSAIDARDAYTRGHSVRVGHLARAIGEEMGLSSADQQHLLVGGYLHDIGKIGIRDDVLLKPGRLDPAERAAIQDHPEIGLAILAPVGLPEETLAAIGQHHERLDGSGYPLGLRGDDVSIYARIVTVADVYDALITDRPYRAALPLETVFGLMHEEVMRGLIDGDAVAALARIEAQWAARRAADPTLAGLSLSTTMIRPLVGRQVEAA
ncbi:MAG: HD domain-containing protein [Dehalococcoidia bacterium]|nr:HD domain-containing protein [Dehalococcoidia bacterium]